MRIVFEINPAVGITLAVGIATVADDVMLTCPSPKIDFELIDEEAVRELFVGGWPTLEHHRLLKGHGV